MNFHRSFMICLAAITVAACSDTVEPLGPYAHSASVGAISHQVLGSGHVQTAAGLREFTFHAMERTGGEVSGSYKVVLPNGLFFEADVTCLSVTGNTGWVAGRIRDTNAGVVDVGSLSMFYATDGGEGEGATDIVSVAAFNMPEGTDIGFCHDQPTELQPLTVSDGNVQVR